MKTKIQLHELQEAMIETTYPTSFYDKNSEITERTYSGEIFLGKGAYKEIFFEGIHIGYGDLRMKNDTLVSFESDFETVEMHFNLCGETFSKDNLTPNQFRFGCNQHNIVYANGFKGLAEWSSSKNMRVFEINISPTFFQNYLPQDIKGFDSFLEKINHKKTSALTKYNFHITPAMLLLINKIMSCQRTGKFKSMFLESKVIELLLLQLEQINDHQCDVFCSLKKGDIEKIYAVKELLTNNLSSSFSLVGLAKKVGTNEFTLKKGFKELFGTTVFGFWNHIKMQEAKRMLLDYSFTVSEVANKTGYKNPQHFSTAFKKYFGTNPSQLKH